MKKSLKEKVGSLDLERLVLIISKTVIVSAIVVLLLSLILYFVGVLPSLYSYSMWFGDSTSFGDFFDVLNFDRNANPYVDVTVYTTTGIANYPPLPYVIFYVFALIAKIGGSSNMYSANPWAVVSLTLFIICTYVPCYILIFKSLPFKAKTKIFFLIAITVGYLGYFEFWRMNINVLALLFSLIFFIYYRSENKVLRHLSLVSLAVSSAIKLYPMLLILLLLKEKRIRDFILTCIYFGLLIILPFFLLKGGIYNLPLMIKFMFGFGSADATTYYNINDVTVMKLMRSVYGMLFGSSPVKIVSLAFSGVKYLLFIVSVALFFFTKNRFKSVLFLVLALTNFTDNNYFYCLIYLLLPFIELCNQKQQVGGTAGADDMISLACASILDTETAFYCFMFAIPLFYLFDTIVGVGILCVLSLAFAIKNNYHKTLFKVTSAVLIAIMLLAVINAVLLVFKIQRSPFQINYSLQVARSFVPLILQSLLITEGICALLTLKRQKKVS